MSSTTPTGPPPVPPSKPILSTPGSYMSSFQSGHTATIHSINKTHDKPAIAARPIPPPTVPKYSSSFGKIDRERNEFGGNKIDRLEREKEGIGGSYRLASLDRLANRQRLLEQNNGLGQVDAKNNGVIDNNNGQNGGNLNSGLQSKREMFFKGEAQVSPQGPPPQPPLINSSSIQNNINEKNHINTNGTHTNNTVQNSINKLIMKEKEANELNHHQDSNKLATERQEKEKQQAIVRPKVKELDGYVGFANLPNQVYRKAVKKGFEFTLMVVGESGLGKSTLINSMFLSDIYNQEQHPGPSFRAKKTVAVETTKVLLRENGVNLTLTIVDTPGFGDAVDNSNCWTPIIDFVESKYEEYLTAESRVHRKAISDSRVHLCLYFIAPSGHGLKQLDIEFMQRLHDKVNVIPVIAKADTLTPEEMQQFKKQVLNEIAQNKIKIYDFPEPLEDEEEAKALRQLRTRVPFAVVGSNTVIEVEGRKVRGRKYPYGVVEVENLDHCDFIALRNMVVRTHLQDLKDVTNNVHYENYRCRKLAGLGNDGKTKLSNKNPLAQMEEEKREHDSKMKKMEAEMEQVFEMKVKEKKQKLKDSELELTRRHEERKKALELQIRELEERRKAFEQEKAEWEQQNNVTLEELRRKSLEANSKETMDGKEKKKEKKKGLF
ncbi:hypothetical protein PVAND_006754 [Polypedilum vanderplanki]|uniref:Septin-type G domain-containing protein n=1 Tax=Polypedilum vanderplanki TaxID=319348 RepID=A0A9J6C4L8_POLVA|nr:hypothetical protein PVAND_006754 [Polypedilum vanderplanki]